MKGGSRLFSYSVPILALCFLSIDVITCWSSPMEIEWGDGHVTHYPGIWRVYGDLVFHR